MVSHFDALGSVLIRQKRACDVNAACKDMNREGHNRGDRRGPQQDCLHRHVLIARITILG